MVISFFRIVSFCDHVLEKEKSGMARFWRVVPRADGAKGLSKCISGWFVCNAGYEIAGVIVVCVLLNLGQLLVLSLETTKWDFCIVAFYIVWSTFDFVGSCV